MPTLKIKNYFLMVFIPVFTAVNAFAESEEHEKPGTIADLSWPYVNFAIYLAIIIFVLRKPIAQAWQARRSSIESDVVRGKEDLKSAEQALADARKKIATLDAECKRESESIRSGTQGEKTQIIEEAKRRVETIARQTEEGIVAEQRLAETGLRREIGKIVLEKALQLLKTELTPEADKELRRSIASGIGRLAQ